MRSVTCLVGGLATVAGLGLAGAALAQVRTFDGKYAHESIRCFPATGLSYGSNLTIRNGSFVWSFKEDYRTITCRATLSTDGTFNARECGMSLSGKVEGTRLTMVQKTDQWECTSVKKRQGDPPARKADG